MHLVPQFLCLVNFCSIIIIIIISSVVFWKKKEAYFYLNWEKIIIF
jgi:hypothetical protein